MTLVWIAVVILWLIGLAGIVIPVLPGIGFVFGGILLYAVIDGFSTIAPATVIIFALLTLAVYGLSYLGAVYGVKKAGGARNTSIGTLAGAVVGLLFVGPLGLLLGAFIGAFLGSLTEGKSEREASKAAIFSVVGIIGSAVVQFILALVMIIAFVIIVLT